MAMSLQLRAGPMVCLPADASGTEYVFYNGCASPSASSSSDSRRGRGEAEGERKAGNGNTKERETVKSSKDKTSSETKYLGPSSEGQSDNDVPSKDITTSIHEEDRSHGRVGISEVDGSAAREADGGLPRLGLLLERPGSPDMLRNSSRPSDGSIPGSDADSAESEAEAVVEGTSDDDEESDDTTSDDWSSSDEESSDGSDEEVSVPRSHEVRCHTADDQKAQVSPLPSSSSSQDSAKEPEQLSTELLAEKRMAAALELADMIEKIQKQNALHALKRVQAMDTCFLLRVGKLVKHGETTGEWGETPDDVRMRTTYDLSAYKEEPVDVIDPQESREETVEPQQEDALCLEAGVPRPNVPSKTPYTYTAVDGQCQGRRLGIGEIRGSTACFDLSGREPIGSSTAGTSMSPTYRYRLRSRKTGELFTVRTDEAAGELWRRQGEALDKLKAEEKKNQTVDDEEMKMCENILKARAQRRKERQPGLLRWESMTD